MSDHPFTRCPVLHEDRFLLIVDKPAGVLSHPNRKGERAEAAFRGDYDLDSRTFSSEAGTLWLIHRLDQDTSGVLMAARDEVTAQLMREAFDHERLRKVYRAMTRGPGWSKEGRWLDHLRTESGRGQVRTQLVLGQRPNADARFRLLHSDPKQKLSWIEIELITGRTHQIRVQAAARRNPVVGDDVYGAFGANKQLRAEGRAKRLCLHAYEVHFKHPKTHQLLVVTAPVPDDLRVPLK